MDQMTRTALLLILMIAAQTSFAAKRKVIPTARPVLDGYDANELSIVEDLHAKGQIDVARCAEIADSMLTRAGLPKLGYGSPVRGDRTDLDRRGETLNPPIFVDGLIQSHSPYRSERIDARSRDAAWTVNIQREKKSQGKDTMSETTFFFTVRSRMNQSSCDLDVIQVKSGSYSDQFDAHACLALLQLKDQEALSEWIPDQELQSSIKSDCELGIHYFGSLKDLVADDTKKHMR